jgi:hypothetical protein
MLSRRAVTIAPVWTNVRFGSKADMCGATRDVRYGPIADIASVVQNNGEANFVGALVFVFSFFPKWELFRIIGRIDELTSARTHAAYLDQYRLPHFDEVADVCGLSVEASRWQRFQLLRIKLVAVARVPSAGQDRHFARIRMRVCSDLVARRNVKRIV